MARLTEAQMRAPKTSSAIKILSILLFLAVIPLALSIHWSESLLNQLDRWLRPGHNANPRIGEENQLDPRALLDVCRTHQYTSEIISLDPLVIYINNFTSAQEAEELITIGSPDFTDSYISRSHGPNSLVSGRTSTSAPLPVEHPLVDCILSRARKFMGSMLLPDEPFSVPQLVRYFPGQKYDLHTDFWPEHQVLREGVNRGRRFNRVASFFIFLRDNCTGGYTNFPAVEPASPTTASSSLTSDIDLATWYGEKVAIGEKDAKPSGVKFKPIRGNAVFWVNVDKHGRGDRRVVHAGLPVGEGEKIGLNIWPRKWYGWEDGEAAREKKEKTRWSGEWKE
ncbi:hypothetical protein EK21DRAFT_112359 [Setomelanomma holmii]|uniref:Prolyl 4-hydroxylase alpha subunit domain-containing protein n=1 Tax=Setomelanomma holmii TaxID=210430 RepID=A0A9P4HBG6_9PLEO|nr:hypothetical protein EK21DRAFT_112359 [Setomelanomma holmii]